VKYSYLVSYKAKKRIFVTSNANILQFSRWKLLNFFPHLLNLAYFKILRLHVSKIVFFKNLVLVLKMAVLERFWWQHSQGTLGVKEHGSSILCYDNIIFFPRHSEKISYTRIHKWVKMVQSIPSKKSFKKSLSKSTS